MKKRDETEEGSMEKTNDPMGSSNNSTMYGNNLDMALVNSIKKTDDLRSFFSDSELSTLTLEQKMLSGLYRPKKKRNKNEIELI